MAVYRIGKKIGSGGFGEVYQCTREDGCTFAIKRLSAPTPEERARFCREVRIQAVLRHKNVVPVIASNVDADKPFFVMPKAEYSLRQFLKTNHGEEILWVFREIADGIDHAHQNGVVHRDLKPENILFFGATGGEQSVAISDFGLGRFMERDSLSLTCTNVGMGTVHYMAPEQFSDAKNVTQVADIYALGKILYELLTGEVPFPAMDVDAVPPKYRYIIRKACQADRRARYQSVRQFRAHFDLATDKQSHFNTPTDEFRKELQQLMASTGFPSVDCSRLVAILVTNLDDNALVTEVLPKIPEPILKVMLVAYADELRPVMEAYDRAVSGPLPYEYCDVAANFYDQVFHHVNDTELKLLVLRRLPHLGYRHNRWHVRHVMNRLISELTDPVLVLAVRDEFEQHPEVAKWHKEFLGRLSIPTAIREVLPASSTRGSGT